MDGGGERGKYAENGRSLRRIREEEEEEGEAWRDKEGEGWRGITI